MSGVDGVGSHDLDVNTIPRTKGARTRAVYRSRFALSIIGSLGMCLFTILILKVNITEYLLAVIKARSALIMRPFRVSCTLVW